MFFHYLDIIQSPAIISIRETTTNFILSWTTAPYLNLCSYKVVVNDGVIAENLQTTSLTFDITPYYQCKAYVAKLIAQSPSGKEGPAQQLSFARSEYTDLKENINSCVF